MPVHSIERSIELLRKLLADLDAVIAGAASDSRSEEIVRLRMRVARLLDERSLQVRVDAVARSIADLPTGNGALPGEAQDLLLSLSDAEQSSFREKLETRTGGGELRSAILRMLAGRSASTPDSHSI